MSQTNLLRNTALVANIVNNNKSNNKEYIFISYYLANINTWRTLNIEWGSLHGQLEWLPIYFLLKLLVIVLIFCLERMRFCRKNKNSIKSCINHIKATRKKIRAIWTKMKIKKISFKISKNKCLKATILWGPKVLNIK